MRPLCHPEIESRVVYENHHVRRPRRNVRKTALEPVHVRFGLQKHLDESDDGSVLVVLDKSGSALVFLVNVIHEVTAPETDIRLRVFFVKSAHQVRAVKVAGCLACYDVVFH